VGFFSIGGGGSQISGVPPSQVYLNGTALNRGGHLNRFDCILLWLNQIHAVFAVELYKIHL
jgi:hypothetical protein